MSNLPSRIRKAVCAASDGNPLFAEELARSLLDSDAVLRQQGGGMPLASLWENGQHELPGSIESVIMSRVDHLEETAKETLKTASVIGRTFVVRVLSSVVGSDEVVQNGLVVLKRADLVLDRRLEPDPECMFKHVLVQEATYNSILLKRRRDLHARVGETIERLFGDRLEDLFGLLAHHYARAELWEKAQHYLLKAGDQADRLAADEEALAHFQAASETYMRAFGRQAEPIWQAVIARKIGEAHYRKGDHEEAREKFRAALRLLGSRDPQSSLGLSLQILFQIALQIWHRMLPIESFDRRLGSGRSVDDELVRIFIMQWWLNFFESPHRTLLYSLKTLNESERRGVVNGIVHSCSSLGFVCSAMGAHTLAQKYHHRAVRQAGESDNPIIIGHAELGLGWHGCYSGQWSEAVEHFRRSADLCRRAGDLRQWGSATWGMVLVLCHLGRFAAAWAHAHELFEISEASGDQVNLRWSRVAEGMVLLRVGLPSEATAKLEVARRDGRAASDWQIYTKATCELARCCLQRGDLKMAEDVVCDAVATVRLHGLRGHHVSDLQNVRTLLLLAKLAYAHEGSRISALRRQTRRVARQAIRGGKIFRGSLPEARRLRGQYAWLVGDAAEAEAWWQSSRKLCEELGASYDLALTELELGCCLDDPLHQERGEALLAESRHGIPAYLTAQAH